jgi:hypothetical protein
MKRARKGKSSVDLVAEEEMRKTEEGMRKKREEGRERGRTRLLLSSSGRKKQRHKWACRRERKKYRYSREDCTAGWEARVMVRIMARIICSFGGREKKCRYGTVRRGAVASCFVARWSAPNRTLYEIYIFRCLSTIAKRRI